MDTMQRYTFIICTISAVIIPKLYAEWDALFPFQTKFGKSCITACEERGYSYYWCYLYGGVEKKIPRDNYGGYWGRCSPSPGVTVTGALCNGTCQPYKTHYYYCTTGSNGSWDYCGDTRPFKPSSTVVRQRKTKKGVNCVSPCEQTPGYNRPWCYKAGDITGRNGWDYCSYKPYFDATVSSQMVYTYVGSKCLTSCQPLGSGANYCYDASTKPRLCSRIQWLSVNNEKCHSECDLQAGNSSAPIQIYFWCWTNDPKSTWDYCSIVNDNQSLGNEMYPKSRIPLKFTKSNSTENIYSHQDEQGIGRVTFFERLLQTGNETFYEIHNKTKLRKWALECLENWKENKFKLPNTNESLISAAGATIFTEQSKYEFQGDDYITMHLLVNICPGKLKTIAKVHAPVALLKKYPEQVIDAILWSMHHHCAVHIERFNYNPSESNYTREYSHFIKTF